MLKMECLKKGKNIIKGSSELRIMQNNHTPILDLLVRESLQNSLDAKKNDINTVFVKYLHSKFDVNDLCNEFELINKALKSKSNNNEADFLAIMDKNTIGLTGDLSGNYDVNHKENENLGKLVFHIMEEQGREGAGGSWGIGKTLYYRVGNGLVIYYSRIQNADDYQDRLVAAVVEDETKDNGLLSLNKQNVGVAWFGEIENGKDIKAVTDSNYISKFLNIFNLKPLTGNETGTYVIIPFINEKELLNNNLKEDSEKVWWNNSIEDYLYVSCLRWYFPRMSNNYKHGPKLKVTINNDEVVPSNETNTIIYQKYIELYDAFYEKKSKDWINVETIQRKQDLVTNNIGKFIYGMVSKDEIGESTYNLPNPNQYALMNDHESKRPLVCYCRNAGMIVNYELFSRNLSAIDCPDDKYIIGIFVVDPNNEICCSPKNIKLDEYLRESEKSDHSSWEDHPLSSKDKTLRIVDRIYKGISDCLNNKYGSEKMLERDLSIDISLARKYGDLFLPDVGFGNDPRRVATSSSRGGGFTKVGKNKIKLLKTVYNDELLVLEYEIILKDKVNSIIFNNKINTIGGKYSALDWEDEGFLYPCNISRTAFQCTQKRNKKYSGDVVIVNKNSSKQFEGFDVLRDYTKSKKCYAIQMIYKNENFYEMIFKVSIGIETTDKLIQTYCDVVFDRDN